MMWHDGWFFGGWGGLLGFGVFILLVVLFVVLVGGLLRSGRPSWQAPAAPPMPPPPPAIDPALQILRERFARGEISEEEYAARKNALTS